MLFIWSDAKRTSNLKDHGFDFADAPRVFEESTYPFEDDRFLYGEQRFVTLGLLAGIQKTNMKSALSHSAKRPGAKPKSISMQSKTDWARMKAKGNIAIAEEHPEADIKHIVRAWCGVVLCRYQRRRRYRCAWIMTCSSGSRRKDQAIKRGSTPFSARSVMRRSKSAPR